MESATVRSIKNAFLQLNSPKLFSSAISIRMNQNGDLQEVRLCYDLHYRFLNCRHNNWELDKKKSVEEEKTIWSIKQKWMNN